MARQIDVHLEIPGREELHLSIAVDLSGQILNCQLQGVGSCEFLMDLAETRKLFTGALDQVRPLSGRSTSRLLLREAVLRAQGQWQLPYSEEELCHCRMIATSKVHQAILVGAHTTQQVSAETSASTACGTCRPDVQDLLDYILDSRSSGEPA